MECCCNSSSEKLFCDVSVCCICADVDDAVVTVDCVSSETVGNSTDMLSSLCSKSCGNKLKLGENI